MKATRYLLFALLVLAAGLFGAFLGRIECRPDKPLDYDALLVEEFADTMTAIAPVPALSEPRQTVTARFPLAPPSPPRSRNPLASAASDPSDSSDLSDPCAPRAADSAEVEIPITRNVYEDTLYRAVVSGYMASLDTLEIYSRREVVTVRQPPKRWHIGVSAGFGMTPRGFQPVIAATLTYSLYSF